MELDQINRELCIESEKIFSQLEKNFGAENSFNHSFSCLSC